MRGRKKAWAVPYLGEHLEVVRKEIAPDDPFLAQKPLYLEVGIGKGDFIMGMAEKQIGFYLGIEKEPNVLAMATRKVVESGRNDILLLEGDFDDFEKGVGDHLFDAVYLNFSDPWPKRKHWKRRLTIDTRLKRMIGLLKEGGSIIMKTDNDDLFAFTLEQIELAGLRIVESTTDYAFEEDKDAMSEYERRFRGLGKNINRVVISK